jgi:hypothetical protein
MNALGRIQLRDQLLEDLYKYYFSNKGKGLKTIEDKLDSETYLAYKYLCDKNLITINDVGGNGEINIIITAYGIDEIESENKTIE